MTTPLPPQGPSEPDEQLPGEAELAALYRQLPQQQPSPQLDAAVLQAAARALASDAHPPAAASDRSGSPRQRGDRANDPDVLPAAHAPPARRQRRWSRLPIALSSAATLVLAAGLAWHMREQPAAPQATSETRDEQKPVATATVASPPANAPAGAPMPSPPALAKPVAQIAMQDSAVRPLARHAPPPPVMEVAASPMADMALPAPSLARSKAAAASPTLKGSQPPESHANTNALAADKISEAEARMPTMVVAGKVSPSAPAPAYVPAVAQEPAAPAPPAEKDTATDSSDTPAQELDKIRRLLVQGRDDEARNRLTIFHRAYPQWQLPPELRAQLRKP